MKRSEKILKKNHIPVGLSSLEKTHYENNVLLKHIINNDMRHLWAFIKALIVAILGLYIKFIFFGG